MKRRGFTLIEMLVVIGIIATLMGVMLASVTKFIKSAEKTRCQELVANTATALTARMTAPVRAATAARAATSTPRFIWKKARRSIIPWA
ncbi:MAG: prepilin-type N-terminal cleavage/methylation domain-containing protein, partial [Kiritimatiellae bacterium]|nr:prepilin-type N-terminal cleavage/methylation domain-containing protein [Kiritimatiellia bacterium]